MVLTVWLRVSCHDGEETLHVSRALVDRHDLQDVVDKEENSKQAAGEVDSVILGLGKELAGDAREAGLDEDILRVVIVEAPVLHVVVVDLLDDLRGARMGLCGPSCGWNTPGKDSRLERLADVVVGWSLHFDDDHWGG